MMADIHWWRFHDDDEEFENIDEDIYDAWETANNTLWDARAYLWR